MAHSRRAPSGSAATRTARRGRAEASKTLGRGIARPIESVFTRRSTLAFTGCDFLPPEWVDGWGYLGGSPAHAPFCSGCKRSQLRAHTNGSDSDTAPGPPPPPPAASSAAETLAQASQSARTWGSGAARGVTRAERRAGLASWHCGGGRGGRVGDASQQRWKMLPSADLERGCAVYYWMPRRADAPSGIRLHCAARTAAVYAQGRQRWHRKECI